MKRMLLIISIFGVMTFGNNAKAMLVEDPSNLAQNLISAQEAVRQTTNMIEQLKTQIQQYERMLKDALSLPDFVAGDLKKYLNDLQNFQNDVLGKFSNVFGGSSSSSRLEEVVKEIYGPSDLNANASLFSDRDTFAEVFKGEVIGNELTKTYADAALKVTNNQIESIDEFEERYSKVIDASQNAEGHMQAIQAQTEMISLAVEILGKIHHLLLANSAMEAVRHETVVAKETRERFATSIVTGDSALFKSEVENSGKEHRFFDD